MFIYTQVTITNRYDNHNYFTESFHLNYYHNKHEEVEGLYVSHQYKMYRSI
jgi:hypothetical protein